MKHTFMAGAADKERCAAIVPVGTTGRLCSQPEIAHTDKAECDFCDYVGIVDTDKKNNLCCPDCLERNNSVVEVVPTIAVNDVLQRSREIDTRIQVRTDIFNAETVSITELKSAIDNDPSIENKPFALATEVYNRFKSFGEKIFSKNEELVELTTKQRAHQTFLNQMANQLRAEEREKLKIQDINYKPASVTAPKPAKVKSTKVVKKKIDKVALSNLSKELGIPEFSLQMLCVQRNLAVEELGVIMRKNIEDAKKAQ